MDFDDIFEKFGKNYTTHMAVIFFSALIVKCEGNAKDVLRCYSQCICLYARSHTSRRGMYAALGRIGMYATTCIKGRNHKSIHLSKRDVCNFGNPKIYTGQWSRTAISMV